MNEITKIHLGRQAFTIAVDAHKALQEYLRAIKRHMGDSDEAVEEVELRMAELLAERGITGDKVILLKDIEYLKSQLGEPGDFGDDEDEADREDASTPKRLFRDTKNAMIAGVAAGIGKYLNVDPLWIRLIFVAFLFAGGSSILVYIILWLIVPEAKTSSERLQMQGKPVTVDALKDVVERADVKGAAQRAQRAVGTVVHGVLKAVLIVVGLGLVLGGVGALLGLIATSVYWALNHDLVPAHIFPVGTSEVILVGLALLSAAMIALFLLSAGLSVMRRKWSLPGWGLGAMIAIFLASLAVSGALAADAAPKIRQRYEASQHSYTRTLPEFHKLRVIGTIQSNISYKESANFGMAVKYRGDADFSKIVADVSDGTLTVDSNEFIKNMTCQNLCLFHSPYVEIVVQGPKLEEVTAEIAGTQISLPNVNNQTIKVQAKGGWVSFPNFVGENLKAVRTDDGTWTLTFAGDYKGVDRPQEVSVFEDTASIAAKNVDLAFDGQCGTSVEQDTSAHMFLYRWFDILTVNGKLIGAPKDLQAARDESRENPYRCLDMPESSIDNL